MFYASALKSLKRDFGDPLVVQQSLKCIITWLETIGCLFLLNSTEYLTKAVKRLANFPRYSFYKYCNPIKYLHKNIYTLKEFEKWLENEMQQFFNPYQKHFIHKGGKQKG